jgi:ABC-type spermidine/putrescine transport system permease subunit II
MINATINTLWVALVATIISTVCGTLLALAMERYRFRGRTGMDALLYLPIVIPEIVMASGVASLLSFAFGITRIVHWYQIAHEYLDGDCLARGVLYFVCGGRRASRASKVLTCV